MKKGKRNNVLIYGEETVQLNVRVPKSKKSEIAEKFSEILDGYVSPVVILSGISSDGSGSQKGNLAGVDYPTAVDFKKVNVTYGKKRPIDEIYDCIIVSAFPDVEYREYLDARNVTMLDRNDVGVFYAEWEGEKLMFNNEDEFQRFFNDANLRKI